MRIGNPRIIARRKDAMCGKISGWEGGKEQKRYAKKEGQVQSFKKIRLFSPPTKGGLTEVLPYLRLGGVATT